MGLASICRVAVVFGIEGFDKGTVVSSCVCVMDVLHYLKKNEVREVAKRERLKGWSLRFRNSIVICLQMVPIYLGVKKLSADMVGRQLGMFVNVNEDSSLRVIWKSLSMKILRVLVQ